MHEFWAVSKKSSRVFSRDFNLLFFLQANLSIIGLFLAEFDQDGQKITALRGLWAAIESDFLAQLPVL